VTWTRSSAPLADLDARIAECHRLGLPVVLDWVLNHTSDEHPWSRATRSGRDGPRRDWYVWPDGAPDGGPPNNWRSRFDAVGAGWTHDPATLSALSGSAVLGPSEAVVVRLDRDVPAAAGGRERRAPA
jgi:glycosidase